MECPDDKFTDRVAVLSKLLEVWSEGDEVELRCNEAPQVVTAQLSAADVQLLTNSRNKPGLLLVLHQSWELLFYVGLFSTALEKIMI